MRAGEDLYYLGRSTLVGALFGFVVWAVCASLISSCKTDRHSIEESEAQRVEGCEGWETAIAVPADQDTTSFTITFFQSQDSLVLVPVHFFEGSTSETEWVRSGEASLNDGCARGWVRVKGEHLKCIETMMESGICTRSR